jgi:hypothetical protein
MLVDEFVEVPGGVLDRADQHRARQPTGKVRYLHQRQPTQ